jgi:putative oxidoreductase
MLKRLLATTDSPADAIARLALGIAFFPHGAQKALGWFGGYGLEGTYGFFTARMGIPAPFAVLAIAAEFLGSLGLIFGCLGRIAAFGIFCVMATAVALVHGHVGFFMNWAATYPAGTEGFEYHILAMGLALVVMVRGSGPGSIDRTLSGRG